MQRTATTLETAMLDEPSREQTLSDEIQLLNEQRHILQQEYQSALYAMSENRAQIALLVRQKAEALEQFALYDQQIKKLEAEIDRENQLTTRMSLRKKLTAKLRDSISEFQSEKKTVPVIESSEEIAARLITHRDRYKNDFDQAVFDINNYQQEIDKQQARAVNQQIALEKNQERINAINIFIEAIKVGISEFANNIDKLRAAVDEISQLTKQAAIKQKRHISFIASGWFKTDENATQYLIEMRSNLLDKITSAFQIAHAAFDIKAFLMKQALICVHEEDIENKFQLNSIGDKLTAAVSALATINMNIRSNRVISENMLSVLVKNKRERLLQVNETNKLNRNAIMQSYSALLQQHEEYLAKETCYFARLFCNKQKRYMYINELRTALYAYDVREISKLYTSSDKQAIANLKVIVKSGMKRYRPGFFSFGYSKTAHPAENLHHILKLLDGQLEKLHTKN